MGTKEQPVHEAVPDPMRHVHSDAGADGAEMPIDEHGLPREDDGGDAAAAPPASVTGT